MDQSDIDGLIDELSDEQRMIASIRTFKKMGIDFQLEATSILVETSDFEGREDEFGETFVLEAFAVMAEKLRQQIVEEGLGENVLKDGELVLELNESGKQLVQELGIELDNIE